MKLVDILARELKEWPDGVLSLSQIQHNGAIINGKGYDGREWDRLQLADDTPPAGVMVTRAQWQAAVDALKADECEHSHGNAEGCPDCGLASDPAWSGEGNPPVGLEIECTFDSWGYWLKGKVLCYGEKMIFMQQQSRKEDGNIFEGSMNPSGIKFRPIRTPEQIAAEEREKEILEIFQATGLRKRDGGMEVALAIYLAGYRKQESGK